MHDNLGRHNIFTCLFDVKYKYFKYFKNLAAFLETSVVPSLILCWLDYEFYFFILYLGGGDTIFLSQIGDSLWQMSAIKL